MTTAAELVKELRGKALRDCVGQVILAEKTAEWQAAAALSSTQARADKLEAELAEAKRQRDWLASEKEQAIRLKEAAESSLAAANERVKELKGALQPFAKKATAYEARHPRNGYPLRDSEQITHRLGDFRNARTALIKEPSK